MNESDHLVNIIICQQVEGTQRVKCELLREKLLSLCEKSREAFPSNVGFNNLFTGGLL